jgi:hypothetical protein
MCGVLSSPIPEVQLAALDCLAAMSSGNETVGAAIINTNYMGKSLISQVNIMKFCCCYKIGFPHE